MKTRRIIFGPGATGRIGMAAAAWIVFVLTLVIGNAFAPSQMRLTRSMVGHDFLAFYTAGTFAAEGRTRELYNLEKVKVFQHNLARREGLEIGQSFGPFWNPPFYAWVFAPLSRLPYGTALTMWEAINALCLVAALWLMARMVRGWPADGCGGTEDPSQTTRVGVLVPLVVLGSMPAIQAFSHGQNTMTSLLLVAGSITLWQGGHRISAGAIAGLLFYKPQLGAIFAAALILVAGRRAILGLAIAGVWLLAINLLTMPGTMYDYLREMPGNLRQFQVEQPYLWDRHMTLRAFWRLLLQGRDPGEMWLITRVLWLVSWAALAGSLGWAWLRLRGVADAVPRQAHRDEFVAAAIVAMPLLMPFYFDYDLLLVSAAAVLTARAARRCGETRTGLVLAWVVLFVVLFFNSALARVSRVNVAVILLAAIAMMTMRAKGRGMQREVAGDAVGESRISGQ